MLCILLKSLLMLLRTFIVQLEVVKKCYPRMFFVYSIQGTFRWSYLIGLYL